MAIGRPHQLPPLKGVEDAGVPELVEMPFFFVRFRRFGHRLQSLQDRQAVQQ